MSRARSTTTPSSGDAGPLRDSAGELRLAVWVTPGGRRSELRGVADGRLRVRVAAAPVEGRANRELCRFLAETLGVPQGSVVVTSGESGRRKSVRVRGVALETARRALGLTASGS
jgi:uncharacterized protein